MGLFDEILGSTNDGVNDLLDTVNNLLNDPDNADEGILNILDDTVDDTLGTVDNTVDSTLDILNGAGGGTVNNTLDTLNGTADGVVNILDGAEDNTLDTLNNAVNSIYSIFLTSDGNHENTLTEIVNNFINITNSANQNNGTGTNTTNGSNQNNGTGANSAVSDFINQSGSGNTNSNNGTTGSSNNFGEISTLRKLFSFDIVNDKVAAIYEHINGINHPISLDLSTVNLLVDTDIILGGNTHFGLEITRYEDKNNDGLYVRSFEQSIISPEAEGPHPHFTEVLRYSPTESDDLIVVREDEFSLGGAGKDTWVIKGLGDLIIADLEAGETINIDMAIGIQNIEQVKSHVTNAEFVDDDFVVTFGEHASITLISVNPEILSWDIVQIWS